MAANNPRLRSALRRALLTSVSIPILVASPELLAQEEGEVVDNIIVTGSRIARDPNLGAPVAVQSVTGENIRLSGKVDVAEVVRTIPALLTSEIGAGSAGPAGSAFDTDNSSVFSAAGESVLQLRGMGTERTLVLVDGRRHVAGSPGTQAVDINTIPPALIERVEVLTGGASAIYGADAVTGVVNFIMKDDFEGFEVDVQGGISGEGDGEDYRLAATWGKNFMNDRANFTVSVDYRKREHILQRDRDWSADNGIGSDDNNPALRFQQGDPDRRRAGADRSRGYLTHAPDRSVPDLLYQLGARRHYSGGLRVFRAGPGRERHRGLPGFLPRLELELRCQRLRPDRRLLEQRWWHAADLPGRCGRG